MQKITYSDDFKQQTLSKVYKREKVAQKIA